MLKKGWMVENNMCGRPYTQKVFYGAFPLVELLQTSKLTSDLIQRLLVKTRKRYCLKGAGIPNEKVEDDVEVL